MNVTNVSHRSLPLRAVRMLDQARRRFPDPPDLPDGADREKWRETLGEELIAAGAAAIEALEASGQPLQAEGSFSVYEDACLLAGRAAFGARWLTLEKMIPGRSAQDIKMRWVGVLKSQFRKHRWCYAYLSPPAKEGGGGGGTPASQAHTAVASPGPTAGTGTPGGNNMDFMIGGNQQQGMPLELSRAAAAAAAAAAALSAATATSPPPPTPVRSHSARSGGAAAAAAAAAGGSGPLGLAAPGGAAPAWPG